MLKYTFINLALALVLSPLIPGIINRIKSLFAGRKGPSIFQLYFDLFKLLKKGAVYSESSSFFLKLAPSIILAFIIGALLIIPFGGTRFFSFQGDVILFIYFFAGARIVMIFAALDTGSSFEGMGAAREASFGMLAEPAFIISLVVLMMRAGSLSIGSIFKYSSIAEWKGDLPVLVLVLIALFIIYLSENCRIPFDDPNTHLELTMIHEVMILDYSGPDLAFILYASSLKLWIFATIIVTLFIPMTKYNFWDDTLLNIIGIFILAVVTGVVESVIARSRFSKVPQLLLCALSVSIIAFILILAKVNI